MSSQERRADRLGVRGQLRGENLVRLGRPAEALAEENFDRADPRLHICDLDLGSVLLAAVGAGEGRPVRAGRAERRVEQRLLDLDHGVGGHLRQTRPDLGRADRRAVLCHGRGRLLDVDRCRSARVPTARVTPGADRVLAKLGRETCMVAAVGRSRGRGERTTLASVTAKRGTTRNRHLGRSIARERSAALGGTDALDGRRWEAHTDRSGCDGEAGASVESPPVADDPRVGRGDRRRPRARRPRSCLGT